MSSKAVLYKIVFSSFKEFFLHPLFFLLLLFFSIYFFWQSTHLDFSSKFFLLDRKFILIAWETRLFKQTERYWKARWECWSEKELRILSGWLHWRNVNQVSIIEISDIVRILWHSVTFFNYRYEVLPENKVIRYPRTIYKVPGSRTWVLLAFESSKDGTKKPRWGS